MSQYVLYCTGLSRFRLSVYVYCGSLGSIFRGLNGNCFGARMRPPVHPLNCFNRFNCHQCGSYVCNGDSGAVLCISVDSRAVYTRSLRSPHGYFDSGNMEILRGGLSERKGVATNGRDIVCDETCARCRRLPKNIFSMSNESDANGRVRIKGHNIL